MPNSSTLNASNVGENIAAATPPIAGQPVPVLETKIAIPPHRSDVVIRSRLTDRLERGLAGKLSLISAPAGFGKTTLVTEWLERSDTARQRTGWIALDPGDNDPGRFFTYFVRALQTVEPDFGPGLINLMQTVLSHDASVALVGLINALNDLPQQVFIVLDDYHVIDNQAIQRALAYVLEHQPDTLHVIMTTRTTPRLPLARLRARRQVNVFRADDLRFSVEEAATFLNGVMGLDLPAARIEALEQRTEGWIAALLLAALSTEGAADSDAVLDSFGGDHRYVFDFLAEEVFKRQPESLQTFLSRTSVLNRISAGLAGALLDGDHQETLDQLVSSNLFTIPLDNSREWYRYHHLFGEFLSARYREQDPEGWNSAHVAASDWFYANDDRFEAVEHALTISDEERLIKLIGEVGRELIRRGRIPTISRWLEALPDEAIAAHPPLTLSMLWTTLLDRRFKEVPRWLRAMDVSSIADPRERARYRAYYAVCEATYARFRADIDYTYEQALVALDIFNAHGLMDEPDVNVALLHMGSALRMRGDTGRSAEILTEAINHACQGEDRVVELNALSQLAFCYGELGSLAEAESWARETLAREEQYGLRRLVMTESAWVTLAFVLREREMLDEAQPVLDEAIQLIRTTGNREDLGAHLLVRYEHALVALARGDTGSARRIADELLELAEHLRYPGDPYWRVTGLRAHVHLLLGMPDAALEWAAARAFPSDAPVAYVNERAAITRAWIDLDQGRLDEADALLSRLHEGLVEAGREYRLAQGRLILAVVRQRRGLFDQAESLLEQAVCFAAGQQCRRLLLDTHPDVRDMLVAARERGAASGMPWTEFLQEVLGRDGVPRERAVIGGGLSPFEPLTMRELEVLKLLNEGISNREIADRLFVSVGTIKRHTHNLYGKLGVSNRTQAILRGEELGLLGGV